ncbi:unnamed protein product [Rotaria sp. Silwood2]|nr:unnamed protein product [Rotaria sp. Silwood2]
MTYTLFLKATLFPLHILQLYKGGIDVSEVDISERLTSQLKAIRINAISVIYNCMIQNKGILTDARLNHIQRYTKEDDKTFNNFIIEILTSVENIKTVNYTELFHDCVKKLEGENIIHAIKYIHEQSKDAKRCQELFDENSITKISSVFAQTHVQNNQKLLTCSTINNYLQLSYSKCLNEIQLRNYENLLNCSQRSEDLKLEALKSIVLTVEKDTMLPEFMMKILIENMNEDDDKFDNFVILVLDISAEKDKDKQTCILAAKALYLASETHEIKDPVLFELQEHIESRRHDVSVYLTVAYVRGLATLSSSYGFIATSHVSYVPRIFVFEDLQLGEENFADKVNKKILYLLYNEAVNNPFEDDVFRIFNHILLLENEYQVEATPFVIFHGRDRLVSPGVSASGDILIMPPKKGGTGANKQRQHLFNSINAQQGQTAVADVGETMAISHSPRTKASTGTKAGLNKQSNFSIAPLILEGVKLNKLQLNDVIKQHLKDLRISDIQLSRAGNFTIYAIDVNSFNRLLNELTPILATNGQGTAKIYVPRSIQRIKDTERVAFVKNVDIEIPESRIIEALKDVGLDAIDVVRLTNKVNNMPTKTIKITFNDPQNRNAFIHTGLQVDSMHFLAEPATQNTKPVQCYLCLQYNHVAKYCKTKQQICARCGDNHQMDQCTAVSDLLKCYNCKGNHLATSNVCSKYIEQEKRMQSMVNQYTTSYKAALPPALNDLKEFPSLPSFTHRSQEHLHNICFI